MSEPLTLKDTGEAIQMLENEGQYISLQDWYDVIFNYVSFWAKIERDTV